MVAMVTTVRLNTRSEFYRTVVTIAMFVRFKNKFLNRISSESFREQCVGSLSTLTQKLWEKIDF